MIITLVAVFVSVALVAGLGTASLLSSTSAERKRLRAVTRAPEASPLPEVLKLSTDQPTEGWRTVTGLVGYGRKEADRLKLRLSRAGLDGAATPAIYAVCERIMPVVAAGIALFVLGTQGAAPWMIALAGALAVFFGPGLYVDHRLSIRRREIENGLPDALDLMVVCIEAGSGLDQAIVKTSDELAIAYPVLANELRILTAEIRAGKPRMEAFKSLANRTRVDDVRALVAMLVQTDKFGTSIGQALRTHADVSRDKRRQRAEEKAQKIAVKLVFPLVLCFFPAFYVVVLGPAVIQFVRTFMK
jgi:tight adherence protein C